MRRLGVDSPERQVWAECYRERMLQAREEIALGWTGLPTEMHELLSWSFAAGEERPGPGVGAGWCRPHGSCTEVSQKILIMQSVHKLIFAVDILPSITQGRKVGVMYWIPELGWMIRPCKVQFLQQLQPTSRVSGTFQMEHVTGREQRLGICEVPPLPLLHVNIHMRLVSFGHAYLYSVFILCKNLFTNQFSYLCE